MEYQMTRFEASFDCGDDDRLPQWEVVEWTHAGPDGTRWGHRAAYADDKHDAEHTASMLNAAYERSLYDTQGCEFDCEFLL
jgi:hypothetical protein